MRAIAIVAAAGRFPGAKDLDALWELVASGRHASRPFPDDAWPVAPASLLDPSGGKDRLRSLQGCPLERDFLPEDAADLEPSHLLAADVARKVWEAAGSGLDPARVRAIVANIVLPTEGANAWTRATLGEAFEAWALGRSACTPGAAPAAPAAGGVAQAVVEALGLGGGGFTLDAACASSLFALIFACLDLEAGRADAVIAGGVSLPDSLYTQVGFTQLQALSPSGICSPFDQRADGLVVGEGAGLFVLQRLEDAVAQGRAILGVIRGFGLSNDVGGSLLSPEQEGQLRAMRQAYEDAGWTPADVDLVECHGTGTPRGDEVEVSSLRALFGDGDGAGSSDGKGGGAAPVIGSVKSNVGHLLTAAGAAGLAKVLGAFRHQALPPTANFSAATALPSLGRLRVLEEVAPWPERPGGSPRRAAISGFGFGGTNAHVLVEEWVDAAEAPGRSARAENAADGKATPAPVETPDGIAIVGLATHFGPLEDSDAFREAILSGSPAFSEAPTDRWQATPEAIRELHGAWIDALDIPLGRFRIPPSELPTLLPQHLLALQTALAAAEDANVAKGPHLRAGAVVGLDLDPESTSFHLRWLLRDAATRWAAAEGASLDEAELETWVEELLEALGPSLDSSRTLGALGGVVASRIARELVLGGPSLTVSAGACSGLQAIEVAARLLETEQVDWMIAGAVDLAGDLRHVLGKAWGDALPFDASSTGSRPGEGAAALVLKREADALRDGDEIYAVIRGIGAGSATDPTAAHTQALRAAWGAAGIEPAAATLVEAHAGGHPAADAAEAAALRGFFPTGASIALGSAKAVIGHAGAAAGMASVAKAALCLDARTLPPHPMGTPVAPLLEDGPLHFLRAREPWWVDGEAPRVAGVSAAGGPLVMHLVLTDGPAAAARPGRAATVAAPEAGAGRAPSSAAAHSVSRRPGASAGEVAFVYPGSGNHFFGMGGLFSHFPWLHDRLGARTSQLRAQMMQPWLAPLRSDFSAGWQQEAEATFAEAPVHAMLGQVAFGLAAHELLLSLGLRPDAAIGYSLGESTALLATGAWPERDALFQRSLSSPLFRSLVFPPYEVAQRVWGQAPAPWAAALLACPADAVRDGLVGTAELLLVNAPGECVIGGKRDDVLQTARGLGREPIFLEGVPSVHGSLAREVEGLYRDLHDQPTLAPEGVRIYSAAWGKPYVPDRQSTVDSIVEGALAGFDFTQVIERAYADGVRTFVEVGPQASCTRMIRSILRDRDHLAVAIAPRGQDPLQALTAALRQLELAGVEVDLGALPAPRGKTALSRPTVSIPVGRSFPAAAPTQPWRRQATAAPAPLSLPAQAQPLPVPPSRPMQHPTPTAPSPTSSQALEAAKELGRLAAQIAASAAATAASHEVFLQQSANALALQQHALAHRTSLLERMGAGAANGALPAPAAAAGPAPRVPAAPASGAGSAPEVPATPSLPPATGNDVAGPASAGPSSTPARAPAFDRDACMEFAVGSLANVLGPAFAEVDGYPTRVRLPDEPLMLVDRILTVEGTLGQLGPGRCVTEHDVLEGQWYLDGGRAPVCISVESGQADLFLCAYLGIDLVTKGERVYRLLDAKVVFHRELARPGETIRYDIRVKNFIQQGTTHLLFFEFDGTIDGQPFITMREGCAGFFSKRQLDDGRGIVGALPTNRGQRRKTATGAEAAPVTALVPMTSKESFGDEAVEALRRGDLEAAFGPAFAGRTLAESLRLPSGRMRLVDRVVELDPDGGRYGMGRIVGEADVQPDAWFLTCHFVDDMVMPGTLMYECCLHTLRIFLLRMGWVIDEGHALGDVHFAPVVGARSELKCRGQVTPTTKQVRYRIDIKEIGYDPEPYAIADASMIIDGLHAIEMEGMSIRLAGATQADVEGPWKRRPPTLPAPTARPGASTASEAPSQATGPRIPTTATADGQPVYDRRHVLAFSSGSAVDAFGSGYAPFEGTGRRMARLPAPPFSFIDEIVPTEGRAWTLEPGTQAVARYDVPPDAWYFGASRQGSMPYAVLLEAALQPCGWLAAWLGSALHGGDEDLFFRNLEGEATLHAPVLPDAGTLRTEVVLESVAPAGGMILQAFRFHLASDAGPIFSGTTRFGFFPAASLRTQAGIPGATLEALPPGEAFAVPRTAPLLPEDPATPWQGLAQPAGAWQMLDRVDACAITADGGFIAGSKDVRPDEWFFTAHFPGDPVMPGSLGIEAFLQLLRLWAERRWPDLAPDHRILSPAPGVHRWAYRGQVRPTSQRVEVQARIRHVEDGPSPSFTADGLLAVDGKVIYSMHDYLLALVPEAR